MRDAAWIIFLFGLWVWTVSAVKSWVLAALKSYNARTDAMRDE